MIYYKKLKNQIMKDNKPFVIDLRHTLVRLPKFNKNLANNYKSTKLNFSYANYQQLELFAVFKMQRHK
jgi:hypothetical protein